VARVVVTRSPGSSIGCLGKHERQQPLAYAPFKNAQRLGEQAEQGRLEW